MQCNYLGGDPVVKAWDQEVCFLCDLRFKPCGRQYLIPSILKQINHLGGGPMVRTWDQEVCSLCGLRFEPCGRSYDGHWRLTWSLTSGPVRLVEVCASWSGHHVKLKKKYAVFFDFLLGI